MTSHKPSSDDQEESVTHVPMILQELAQMTGGKITEVGALPDGSGFAAMDLPLPKDHWLYAKGPGPFGSNTPPMGLRMGTGNPLYPVLSRIIEQAGRYAVRCATMNGKDNDFDPDALVQNLIVGLMGYHTSTGLSECDPECNPNPPPPTFSLEDIQTWLNHHANSLSPELYPSRTASTASENSEPTTTPNKPASDT